MTSLKPGLKLTNCKRPILMMALWNTLRLTGIAFSLTGKAFSLTGFGTGFQRGKFSCAKAVQKLTLNVKNNKITSIFQGQNALVFIHWWRHVLKGSVCLLVTSHQKVSTIISLLFKRDLYWRLRHGNKCHQFLMNRGVLGLALTGSVYELELIKPS